MYGAQWCAGGGGVGSVAGWGGGERWEVLNIMLGDTEQWSRSDAEQIPWFALGRTCEGNGVGAAGHEDFRLPWTWCRAEGDTLGSVQLPRLHPNDEQG